MSTLQIGKRKYAIKTKSVATKKIDQEQNQEIKNLKAKVTSLSKGMPKCRHNFGGTINFDNANPRIYTLNGLQQGDAVNNRSGNVVKAKKLEVSGRIFANAPGLLFDTNIRIMLVKEKTCLGSQISLLQLLGTATPFTYTLRNYQNRDQDRFVILKDIVCGIGPVSTSVNGAGVSTVPISGYPSIKDFKFTIPLNVNVNYSRGNAGTEADIENHGYFLVFITDVTTSNAVAHSFDYNYHFTDA